VRVLYVCGNRDVSGAETVLLRFLKRQPELDAVVLVPSGKLQDALTKQGIRVIRSFGLGQLHRARNSLWPLGFLLRFVDVFFETVAACFQVRPDLVQCAHFAAGMYAILPARLLNIPVVWHIHDIFEPGSLEARVLKILGRFQIRVVAVSEAVRDALIVCGMSAAKITVIYNGIDWEGEFNPAACAQPSDLRLRYGGDGLTLVGLVGLLTEWKGQDVLMKAAAKLRLPAAMFLVIGGSWVGREDFKNSLLLLRDELGLQDSVRFTGHLADVAGALAALDIVVHASVRPDPLPTAVLEAMAMGKIVIASRCGGVPEMIEHGVAGLLCTPGDVDALASALENVIAEPEKFRHLGANARRLIAERFDARCNDASMLRLYDSVVSAGKRVGVA
jgi:glycosyltransferase involved in cell wall biosynthesis